MNTELHLGIAYATWFWLQCCFLARWIAEAQIVRR